MFYFKIKDIWKTKLNVQIVQHNREKNNKSIVYKNKNNSFVKIIKYLNNIYYAPSLFRSYILLNLINLFYKNLKYIFTIYNCCRIRTNS